MGASTSRLERALSLVPDSERIFGLENYGNTCYCNSVLQSLYYCVPFREKLLEHGTARNGVGEENLLTCLHELFQQIAQQRKKAGVVGPKKFVNRLKKDNEMFRGYLHQDAHEFLNFLLNELCDILEKEDKENRDRNHRDVEKKGGQTTWVHDLFQGYLVNETRCLLCESVSRREEAFLDLNLEVQQNTSVTSCIKNFSATEMMKGNEKFMCDGCGGALWEAERRMRIKHLPKILSLHLKRFKVNESLGRVHKLNYRVAFPIQLKLCNTTEDADNPDVLYTLFAAVIHIGAGLNHGHYVCIAKSQNQWLLFDDENVEPISESSIPMFFGSTQEYGGSAEHGYILFYQQSDL
eukprot:jgi/Pico_ML_1/51846/g356.t1